MTEDERQEVESFLRQGVAESTAERYDRNAHEWQEFVGSRGFGHDPWMAGFAVEEKRALVVLFILGLLKKGKSDHYVRMTLSSLHHEYRVRCLDTSLFDSDATIAVARKALGKRARELNLHHEKIKRMPVTLDMVQWLRVRYWKATVEKSMVYIAVVLAFNYMWRVSEYVFKEGSGDHSIGADDVVIILEGSDTRRHPWTITRAEAHKVATILFVIRSSKADRTGKGRYLYLSRKSDVESQLVDDVIEWCVMSGVKQGEPLLSRWKVTGRGRARPTQLKLTRKMVSDTRKFIARELGLDTVGFAISPHSLKIGGVASMKAAGIASSQVKKVAGFASESNCDVIYDRHTPLDDGALCIARDTFFKVLTSEDVRIMVPFVSREHKDRLCGV